jgi:Na+/melibiose symporter-like transporter
MAVLIRFPATSRYSWLGLVVLVVGFGTTSSIFAATVAGTAGITDDEQGLAGALVNTARQVGAAVGVAVLVAVAAAQTGAHAGSTSALADGYRLAMGVWALLALAATLLSILFVHGRVSRTHHQRLREHHLDHPWPFPEFLGHRDERKSHTASL